MKIFLLKSMVDSKKTLPLRGFFTAFKTDFGVLGNHPVKIYFQKSLKENLYETTQFFKNLTIDGWGNGTWQAVRFRG